MSEINNYNDDIYLSSNNNYNSFLTEEDLKEIKDNNLKSKLLLIHEEMLWLKNYKYIKQKFKVIFEVIYLIFQENKREILITKIESDIKSYIERLNYLLNKMLYNRKFSNFKIIKIKK